MKLRSRTINEVVDEAIPCVPKRTDANSFESMHPGMLMSYGDWGYCDGSECDG